MKFYSSIPLKTITPLFLCNPCISVNKDFPFGPHMHTFPSASVGNREREKCGQEPLLWFLQKGVNR